MPRMKTMRLELEKAFCKRAKKLLKKNPFLKRAYEDVLLKLSINPFDPTLHTHPFRIHLWYLADTVHLLDIGTHNEVY